MREVFSRIVDLRRGGRVRTLIGRVTLTRALLALALVVGLAGGSALVHVARASGGRAPWWSADCDGRGTLVTTDPTLGIQICYPNGWNGQPSGQPNYTETTPHGTATLAEWQCVEFSARYLEQFHSMPNKGGVNGKDVASQYYTWYSGTVPGLSVIIGGTTHTFPSVGDVLSTTSGEDPSTGHTGVINYVHIDSASAGNGYAMLAQENTAGGNHGWTPDGTGDNGGWGDSSWPYTKLVIRNWSYYNDDDGSTTPTTPENNVQILHFGSSGGNPSYTGHEVYVIGSNGHLYHYFYNGTAWSTSPQEDLSATTGTTGVTLQGDVSSYLVSGVHFAYAIDTNHHLHEFYYSSGWHHADLSGTVGKTFQGTPSAYGFVTGTGPTTTRHSVNVVGTDGLLYDVYYPSSNGNWGVSAAVSGTQTISGLPSGYALASGSSYYELVYAVDTNGALREYSESNGGSWMNLNTWATLGGVTLAGTPTAYPYTDGLGHQEHDVYVRGAGNGYLYNLRYVYNGSSYAWQTPLGPISTVVTTNTPHANFAYGSPGTHFVYARTSSGALEEFYQSDAGGAWNAQALVASGVSGSPWSYSYLAAGTLTHIVFWPETDGDLHEEYYQSGWSGDLDRGPLSSTVTVASGASAYGF